jgi:hypothetical protein
MNLKEYLADGPKKMFSLLEGIITAELVTAHFCPYISGATADYNDDGTLPLSKYRSSKYRSSKYRVLFTLEEAEQLGFVKRVESVERRVKFRSTSNRVCVTGTEYLDKADFEGHFHHVSAKDGFISFVDDELNDCPPPSERWVEAMPEFMKIKNSWPPGQ